MCDRLQRAVVFGLLRYKGGRDKVMAVTTVPMM